MTERHLISHAPVQQLPSCLLNTVTPKLLRLESFSGPQPRLCHMKLLCREAKHGCWLLKQEFKSELNPPQPFKECPCLGFYSWMAVPSTGEAGPIRHGRLPIVSLWGLRAGPRK